MNIQYYGNPNADMIMIQMVDDHDLEFIAHEKAQIDALTGKETLLVAMQVADWNADLSPWPAPAVFGSEPFGDGAGRTLCTVLEWMERYLADHPDAMPTFYIGGYSLAGLFALWAACSCDRFSGVAAVSPSVWFPGIREFVREHIPQTQAVYLSLGDREERTRNPVMAQVGTAIQEIHETLQTQGIPCTLEWNQENHFRDPDLRTAKGFAWLVLHNL